MRNLDLTSPPPNPWIFPQLPVLLHIYTCKKKKKTFFITDVHSISRASDLMRKKRRRKRQNMLAEVLTALDGEPERWSHLL